MTMHELLQHFHEVAADPASMKNAYLAAGYPIVLVSYYTPEEIVHSMGCIPMAAWGADIQLKEAKRYFPAFICSVMQTLLELGMGGVFDGASAIILPSLCDSLKVMGQNWKYAVPAIPFIPMTYPQNRKPDYAADFVRAGYERVIRDLESATGKAFDPAKLAESITVYNAHNQAMRELSGLLADHPEITAAQRCDIFKSAGFMRKEDHTALVRELIGHLQNTAPSTERKLRILTSGILADSPSLLQILDDLGYQIAADDVAAESRLYRTDAPAALDPLESLVQKYCSMDQCSLLYDPEKKRVAGIAAKAREVGADGVVVLMTKFCDPEEFDYPMIAKKCEEEGIPVIEIEIDRQMEDYQQARTLLEGFREILSLRQP